MKSFLEIGWQKWRDFYNMDQLIEKLKTLEKSDLYPFHMPGHKRQLDITINPYAYDITEIGGFDNLHHATGVLKNIEKRYANLYHAKDAFLLINGSSGGILAAISAATKAGDEILIARNSHKSVYHAVLINRLRVHYVYPTMLHFGINGSISPEDVRAQFQKHPKIRAFVITCPTYDGITSNLEEIRKIVKSYDATLIIDAAHGAHFGLDEAFLPNDAVKYGDLSILSLHKTLPSPTQSAILIDNSKGELKEEIAFYLNVYETSSPSYLMMAAMEYALSFCEPTKETHARIQQYAGWLQDFYEKAKSLKVLEVFDGDEVPFYGKDQTKILISTRKADGFHGENLMECLRESYHLECEMAAAQYVIALSTFMDTREGIMRLLTALFSVDAKLQRTEEPKVFDTVIYRHSVKRFELYEVREAEMEILPVKQAEGRISGEFCYLYPPGIPIVAPGEEIPPHFAETIEMMLKENMQVEGLADYRCKTIKVLK
ncbi:Arginine/lysine/ornithine decarboxylase [Lachnospiraceae bacterium XBB1006]|nr:Arginine/lysine/ornithine decarboxylase [Lachnospiraceae bacterium XBB1006]